MFTVKIHQAYICESGLFLCMLHFDKKLIKGGGILVPFYK